MQNIIIKKCSFIAQIYRTNNTVNKCYLENSMRLNTLNLDCCYILLMRNLQTYQTVQACKNKCLD